MQEVVKIPKGVSSGINLKLTKKGNAGKNAPSGDLILQVNVKDHDIFERNGFNIHTKKKITVSEAILGCTIDVETIRGNMKVNMPPGIQNGDVRKLIQCGINKLPPLQKQRGHHFITFEVEIPKSLSDEQRFLFMKYSQLEDKIE